MKYTQSKFNKCECKYSFIVVGNSLFYSCCNTFARVHCILFQTGLMKSGNWVFSCITRPEIQSTMNKTIRDSKINFVFKLHIILINGKNTSPMTEVILNRISATINTVTATRYQVKFSRFTKVMDNHTE